MSLQSAQIPQKSGLPELVDTEVANTLDLHIATSDFLKIVDSYGDYIALTYVWNSTKYSSDPITAQAEFFRDLVNNKLNLKEDERGTRNSLADSYSYDFVRLDQYLHPHEIWIRGDTGTPEPLVEGDTTRYHALNLVTGADRWVVVEEKDINVSHTVENKIAALNSKFGCDSMDNEFIYYWYRKFQKVHSKVKEVYKKLVTDETKDYFTEFSDSIGVLGRAFEYPDSSTIPFYDITFDMLKMSGGVKVIPNPVPPAAFDKIDIPTKTTILEAAKQVNMLFRTNMTRCIETMSSPSNAHGENLMTDHRHWVRMDQSITLINGIVADTIGNIYGLLKYLEIAQNKQKAPNLRLKVYVENTLLEVDALKNKIKTLDSVRLKEPINSDYLEAQSVDLGHLD